MGRESNYSESYKREAVAKAQASGNVSQTARGCCKRKPLIIPEMRSRPPVSGKPPVWFFWYSSASSFLTSWPASDQARISRPQRVVAD
jgi:hypothetical protein